MLIPPSSAIPGEIRGLHHLHRKYGKLPWKHVVTPAVSVARHGFPVTEDLVHYMDTVTPNSDFLTTDSTWAIDFAPQGRRIQLGESVTRKRYADTLELIADNGPDAFYTGAIANATIQALAKHGGIMTLDDLGNYEVAIREPAQIDYRGYKITACNAPSGGVVALSALNIMAGFNGLGDPSKANDTAHLLDEAMRFSYGQRTKLGDPTFVEGMDGYTAAMLSDQVAAEVRSKISLAATHNVSWYNPEGLESLDTPGTSHVVTADATGLAISLTTTINLLFGSQLMVPETGVIMNNEMNDFSIPGSSNNFGYVPSPANYIRPGKRPMSSISPAIVETPDGRLYFCIGAAGGSRIISTTIQNIHNVLDLNLTVADALSRPRLHDQLVPNVVSFEYAFDNSTVAFMEGIGANVSRGDAGSSAQGLRLLPNGTFEAAGEPRQKNSGGFAV
jgi:gamma-glutamyltranspeptidase / glutathione hydrolase